MQAFAQVLIFIAGGIVFISLGFFVSKALRPNRPSPLKNTSYESGEDPVGNAYLQLNNRFYVIALLFLLFDVELVLLFPWATVFADKGHIIAAESWGWFALVEAVLFVGILFLGLLYAWVRGELDWVKATPLKEESDNIIPLEVYQKFNKKYS